MEGKERMGANAQATINLKALLDVSGVKGAVGNIQKALSGLTLPKNIGGNIERAMTKIAHEFTSVEQLQAKGFGTMEDANSILKSGDKILKYYNDMAASIKQLGLLSDKELEKLFPKKLTDNIKNAKKALSDYTKEVKANAAEQKKLEGAIKKAQTTLEDKKNTLSGKTRVDDAIYKDTKSKIKDVEEELVKKTNERQDYINSRTWKTPTSWKQSNTVHDFDKEIATIEGRLQQLRSQLNTQMPSTAFDELQKEIQEAENKLQEAKTALNDFLSKSPDTAALNKLFSELQKIDGVDLSNVTRDIQGAEQVIESLSADQINQLRAAFDKLGIELDDLDPAVDKTRDSLREGAQATAEFKQEAQELTQLKSRLMSFFGINNAVNIFQRAIRSAFNTVKELDAAMTETAVVTDYSVGDMWNQLPQYTAVANELGTTTLGAYQTMTLFYQQGLKTNEAFAIGTETMKMARIANMDYAQSTDMMTAALRGFNMELNETSAQRVNDVYSELAAITAADTEEIATAMTKTASIAASANMEFETTAALLSQIIETTREAPETAGTAMKTIIARFTEVKKLFDQGQLTGTDGEGEAININKIDEALKSVGMSLQGFLRGEEGIDDIFLQLAQKWDTLDLSTQRYIATMAAGSRQQSRFLAMMSDYNRTMELVDAANNSAGASQKQFEKTIESLESKLNKLKNAWDEFTMGLANSSLIKGAVDILTNILNTANKITVLFGGGLLSSILKVGLALNALKLGKMAVGGLSVGIPKVMNTTGGKALGTFLGFDQFFNKKDSSATRQAANIAEEAAENVSVQDIGDKGLGATFKNAVVTAGEIFKQQVTSSGLDFKKKEELKAKADNTVNKVNNKVDSATSFVDNVVEKVTGKKANAGLLDKAFLEVSGVNPETASDDFIKEFLQTADRSQFSDNDLARYLTETGQYKGVAGRVGTWIAKLGQGKEKGLGKVWQNFLTGKGKTGLFGKALTGGKFATALAGKLGLGAAGAGTAAGALTAAIPVIGAFTAAVILATKAGIKLHDTFNISAEEAQATADANKEATNITKRKKNDFNSRQEDYYKLQNELNNLIPGTNEWKEALIASNEAVISFAKDFPSLQYQLDETTGALTLTEESLASLGEELKRQAEQAQINSLLSSNFSASKQIAELEKQNRKLNRKKFWQDEDGIRELDLEIESNKNTIRNLETQIESQLASAISQLDLSDRKVTENFATAVSENYQEIYDELTEENFDSLFLIVKDKLVEQLAKAYNMTEEEVYSTYGDGKNLDKERAKQALAQVRASEQIRDNLEAAAQVLEELGNNIGDEAVAAFNKIMSGDERVDLDEIKQMSPEQWQKYAAALGYEDSPTGRKQAQQDFATELANIIKYQTIATSTARNALAPQTQQQFSQLGQVTQKEMGYMAEDLEKYYGAVGTEVFSKLFSEVPDSEFENVARQYTGLFNKINFSNPIRALQQIEQYANSSNETIAKMGQTLLDAGAEDGGVLSLSNQFEYLYDNILSVDENVQDLKGDLGELDASDIKELSEEFSDLDKFLDKNNISAATLANILNEINLEGLDPSLITDNVIEAMNAFDSFTNGMLDSLEEWEEMDFGPDTGGFADKIIEGYDDFAEHITAGELGNLQVSGFYDTFFGDGAWAKVAQDVDTAKIAVREFSNVMNAAKEKGDLSPLWEYAFGGGVSTSGFSVAWNEATQQLDWIIEEGTDYIDIVEGLLANNPKGLTRTAIEALLGDAANNDLLLRQIVDQEGLISAVDKLLEDTGKIIDQAVIDMIANQTADPEAARKYIYQQLGSDYQVDTWEADTLSKGMRGGTEGAYQQAISGAFTDIGDYEPQIDSVVYSLIEHGKGLDLYSWNNPAKDSAIGYEKGFREILDILNDEGWDAAIARAEALGPTFESSLRQYEKALKNFDPDKTGDLFSFDLDAVRQFASDDEIFTQLENNWRNGIQRVSEITSTELKALGVDTLTIDWNEVDSTFGGDLQAWYQNQIDNIKLEADAKVFADAFSQSLITAGVDGTEIDVTAILGNSEALYEETKKAITNGGSGYTTKAYVSTSGITDNVRRAVTNNYQGYTATVRVNTIQTSTYTPGSGQNNSGYTQIDGRKPGASGGIVQSYAKGSENIKLTPGTALTGEEGAEIVWNKERGYAYIAGANGPEYNNLQPGDRVFNAQETKQIFRNSVKKTRPAAASGGLITPAYAKSTSSYIDTSDWISGSNSNTVSDSTGKDNETKWKNEFDWLYNLMEDITELEREQTKIQERYADLLKDSNATAAELVKNTEEELSNLYTQQAHQQLALDKRNQEMAEYMAANDKYGQYARYNFEDQTVEIDWDAIEAVQDEELYKGIEEYVSGLEEIQGKIDEADDALLNIENQIEELKDRFEQEYIDFENRVLDALVKERQDEIDHLSNINDSIKDTNSKLLEAIQKGIAQQRQDRQNQKTEDEIAKKERRLAYLRQDTSKDNSLEILSLEEELSSLKEDYTDELVDQKLTKIQDQEDFAAEQRERQIALMESQLAYEQESGQLWAEVQSLLESSVGSDGKLMNDSSLAKLLREQENWDGLSEVQKKVWEESLNTSFNQAYAYVLSQEIDHVALKMDAMNDTLNTIAQQLPNYSQADSKVNTGSNSSGGSGGNGGTIIDGNNATGNDFADSNDYGSKGYDNGGYSDTTIRQMQGFYGTSVDGMWGPNSQAAAAARGGGNSVHSAYTFWKNNGGSDIIGNQNNAGNTPISGTTPDDYQNYVPKQWGIKYTNKIKGTTGNYPSGKTDLNAAIAAFNSAYGPGYQIDEYYLYKQGGLADFTGPAWLDGTKSKPELVLNARDTANFIQLKDVLSDVMRGTPKKSESKSGDTYIDISIQAEIKDDYDVEKLTKKIKSEIYKDGAYRGVNIIHNIR